jgi:entry exclusion lipoprotein TrbK
MKRWALAALVVVALSGCSSEPEAPSVRDKACESIKSVTPGYLEMTWAMETLKDPNASDRDQADAMKVSLDQMSETNKRTEPYTCEGATFERYVEEFGQG